MSRLAGLALFPALLVMAATSLHAQGARGVQVSWLPKSPVQGTLFRVLVTGSGQAPAAASAAGEPLHFTKTDTGWEALAAAPLDLGAELELLVAIEMAGSTDRMRLRVPIARGTYALEKLTVAPRFGGPQDSASQARITRERERALAVSRAAHSTPRLWQEVLEPRDSRVTSAFGSGREFNGQVQGRHTGMDLAGAVGAPVRAAARGVVALADTFYLAGRVIYIDHGAGLVSAYFHLSRHDVAVGDTVQAGQQIGLVGATGRVTGPHLHWVVRYGAVSVDPASFLAIARLERRSQHPGRAASQGSE
jgi:hypothetical protein